MKFEMLALNL